MTANHSVKGPDRSGLFLWYFVAKTGCMLRLCPLLFFFFWGWMGIAVVHAQDSRYQVQLSGALLLNQPTDFQQQVLEPLADDRWMAQTEMPPPVLLDLNVDVPLGKLKGGVYISYRFSTFADEVSREFSTGTAGIESRVWSSIRMTGVRLGVDWIDLLGKGNSLQRRFFLVTNLRVGGGVQFTALTFRTDNAPVAGFANNRQAAFAPAYDLGAELVSGFRLGNRWSLGLLGTYTQSETGPLRFEQPNGRIPSAFQANSYSWSGFSVGLSIGYSFSL